MATIGTYGNPAISSYVIDADGYFVATNVEVALAEVYETKNPMNRGIESGLTVSDDGGLNISWTAGIVFDPTTGGLVAVDAGNDVIVDDDVNFLIWSLGAMTITGVEPTSTEVLVAIICAAGTDIMHLAQMSTLGSRESDIAWALAEIFPTVIETGLVVSEDPNVVNAFDVVMSAGTMYLDMQSEYDVTVAVYSRVTNLVRHYHAAGAWTTDANAEIDVNNYDNGVNRVAIPANRWAKSMFIFAGGRIHWVYATSHYPNAAQAIAGDLPGIPPGLERCPRLTAVVCQQGSAAFPAVGSDNWIDVRPIVGMNYEGTVSDHGSLAGLGDDDHTQYLLASGARALTGAWAVGGFAISGITNLSVTGELDLTGSNVHMIDINPSRAGTQDVISIVPTSSLAGAGTVWKGIHMDGAALDPGVANIDIYGIHIDMTGVAMGTGPDIWGLNIQLPATYDAGTEIAGYFAGDGRWVSICTDTHAIQTSGDIDVTGDITVSGSVDGVDISLISLSNMPAAATGNIDCGAQAITNVGNVDGVDVSAIVAFTTITGITNNVVADGLTDTLTLSSANAILTIVGTAATDTIAFTIVEAQINHDNIGGVSADDHHAQVHALTTHSDVSLADPGADQIVFWDDSDSQFEFLVANTGLSIVGNNLNCDITQYTNAMAQAACVSDAAYGVGWNGVTDIAPSKNAVYDQLVTHYGNTDAHHAQSHAIVSHSDATLADPGADQIVFWDDSDSQFEFLVANTGLSIVGNNLNCDITQYTNAMAVAAVLADDAYVKIVGDTMTGLLTLTHAVAGMIDLNPANTGTQNIIDITPTANLVAGSTWKGTYVDASTLDPATGAACTIIGHDVYFSGVASVDHDAGLIAYRATGSPSDHDYLFAAYLTEKTGNYTANMFFSYDVQVLSKTATYRGLFIDWDGITRDAEAPVLEGIRIDLPADYINFGANKAGYFTGDGRSVTICDTTYALNVSGAMQLNGVITAIDSITLDLGTTINEFSIDGTLVGNSDDALPTEQAVKTYVDAQIGAENELSEMNDVNIAGLADNHVLTYDNATSKWINEAQSALTLDGAALATLTTISMSGQLTNTLAIGNPPFVITSTTVVPNLNVDKVDGYDFDQSLLQADSPIFVALTLSGALSGVTTISAGGTYFQVDAAGSVWLSVINADASNPLRDSPTIELKGKYWTGAATADVAMLLGTDVTGGVPRYKFFIKREDLTNVFSVDESGHGAVLGNFSAANFVTAGNVDGVDISATLNQAVLTTSRPTFAGLDLTPSSTGTQTVINITPSQPLAQGSTWIGTDMNLNALDPATGNPCGIIGLRVNAVNVVSADSDLVVYGFYFLPPPTESSYMLYHSLVEMTAVRTQRVLYSYSTAALSSDATYQGIYLDWDAITRDGGIPGLQGIRVHLPANYTGFGTCYAGYFSGDGKYVYLCDTTYALKVNGAMLLGGAITGVDSMVISGDLTAANIITAGNVDGVDISAWLDQSVKQAASPTFVGLTLSGAIATPTTITTSGNITCGGSLAITTNLTVGSGEIMQDGIGGYMALWSTNAWNNGAFFKIYDSATGFQFVYDGTEIGSLSSVGNLQIDGSLTGVGANLTGELDMTGAGACIDLNPAGTGSKNVIDITPTAALVAGSTWRGCYINGAALDPATGAGCAIMGFQADLAGIVSADGDAVIYAFRGALPATETGYMFYWPLTEMTANKSHRGYYTYFSGALSATATYQAIYIDWDAITRDGGAPILEGVRVNFPADYTDFGASVAGYFSGDGRSVTICDTSYALNVSGAIVLNGNVTALNSLTLDIGTNITEFSTDGTLAGNSNNAVPTEQAVKTYADAVAGGVHTHDGATLQHDGVNSNGGDFTFAVSGDLYLDPAGYDVFVDGRVSITRSISIGVNSGMFQWTPSAVFGGGADANFLYADFSAADPAAVGSTFGGLKLVMSGIDMTNTPLLYGVMVLMPAAYTSASYAGYFSGDGRTVTICDTSYALTVSGAMNLSGAITSVTTLATSGIITCGGAFRLSAQDIRCDSTEAQLRANAGGTNKVAMVYASSEADFTGNCSGSSSISAHHIYYDVITASSSERIKSGIVELDYMALAKQLDNVRPKEFYRRKSKVKEIGFIAEDLPQMVQCRNEKGEVVGYDTIAFITSLYSKILSQDKAMLKLKERLERLEDAS